MSGRGYRGFTLIELILVILVTGILAFSVVSLFDLNPTTRKFAEEKLVVDIAYVRRLAQMNGGTYGIFFEPASERYTLFQTTAATPLTDPANRSQNLVVNYTTQNQFSGVDLASVNIEGTSTLLFDAQGRPRDSNGALIVNNASIVVSNAAGTTTVNVLPNTGKVIIP